MPDSWTFPAPCKLNLFLHITGQRPDGYHNLETLFQLLDYGDRLEFKLAEEIAVTQEPPANFPVAENLVYRAARLLANTTGCTRGIQIHLHKMTPTGAGLGGGSSDAATTLLALNKIWSLGLGATALSELGLQLGADVPVFIRGQTSLATGIGEHLTAVDMPEKWFLVLTPKVSVSTEKVLTHPQLTRDSAALFSSAAGPLLTRGMSPIKMCAPAVQEGRNDCQAVVEMLHAEVANLRKTLEKLTPVQMTGTGSSLFAQFATKTEAEQTLAKLADRNRDDYSLFIARGVNGSPVHRSIDRL